MSSKSSRRAATSKSRAASLDAGDPTSAAFDPPASPRKGASKGQTKSKKALSAADDSIVASLISSETQTELAPAIKSIFEQHRELEVIDSLSQVVEAKEKEIQKICETNFQGFIRSVDELVLVRKGIEGIKSSVVQLNKDMQSSSAELVTKATELNELRGISQNINAAIEVLSTCMYTLGLCAKVKEYVENKKFYPAIKILDQLQQVHLRNVAQYEFGRHLEKRIPLIKDSIKKRVMADVNEWLLQIRNKGGKIGKFSMEQTQAEIKQRDELLKLRQMDARDYTDAIISRRTRAKVSGSASSKAPASPSTFMSADANDITEQSVFDNPTVHVTFAPLYQCSYIFDSLGEKDEFRKYYRENRKLQSRLVLQLPEGRQFMQDYESFLHEIVGFFIIEATVLQTSNELISAYDVSMLWDAAVNKMKSILQVEVAYCADITLLPKLKDFLLVLARTLRKYGFDLTAITDFVRAPLRDRFILVALSQMAAQFERLFLTPDSYDPLVIHNERDYDSLIVRNGLHTLFDRDCRSFPFSVAVPRACDLIRMFIRDLVDFAQNLTEMDPVIVKGTDQLLKLVTSVLLAKSQQMQYEHINQLQVSQAYLNAFFLEKAIPVCGDGTLKSKGVATSGSLRLNYADNFSECKEKLQELLFFVNAKRIDSEFDVFTDTLDSRPDRKADGPRPYISNIINDVTLSFPKMSALPETVIRTMYHRAYQHIARRLIELISGEKIVSWNLAYIASINEDLTLVEDSLKKSPVTGLLDYFTELRQIIDLIMSSDLLAYMDVNVRAKLYPAIGNPKKLLVILEKFREDKSFTKLFVAGTKAKQIATLIQKIKGT